MTEQTDTVVDGTATELPDTQPGSTTEAAAGEPPAGGGQGAALVRRGRRHEVLRPLDTDELVKGFAEYQDLMRRLLTPNDWQNAGSGKRFVKKSGLRKIATAFDLDVQLLRSTVERDADGKPLRAEVWARAIAPSGRFMDGDGYCSADEERFKDAKGRQKLENDLRATATTRAMNRAISGLIGLSVDDADAGGDEIPEMQPASGELIQITGRVLSFLMDGDMNAVIDAQKKIREQFDGQFPAAAAQAIVIAGAAIKRHREGQQ